MYEEFVDTKGVIRIRISKNKQHNGQKKKVQNGNDLQNTHKTKDRVTRTTLKPGGELFQFGVIWAICKL